MVKQFEYKGIRLETEDDARMENVVALLNDLGQEGWELAGVERSILILKREV